ncbi:MAG: hypothetical protein ACYTGB_19850, partial [Planctomycetota bacterium]
YEVESYTLEGKLVKKGLIKGQGFGDCGIGVDAAGNVYVGANVKKSVEKPFPEEFTGQIPAKGWTWWKKDRERPWSFMYVHPYLFHWGSVLKFSPEGGAIYGHPQYPRNKKLYKHIKDAHPNEELKNAPAGASSYRSAYLGREIKVAGAEWRYFGFGNIPSSTDGVKPDPGCVCSNSRFAVDPYGRLYIPNPFLFTVEMVDSAGNRIERIGSYGNADSKGLGFAMPTCPSWAREKLYVLDQQNRRVSAVGFEYAASAECRVP